MQQKILAGAMKRRRKPMVLRTDFTPMPCHFQAIAADPPRLD
jgi:hypothetical protein